MGIKSAVAHHHGRAVGALPVLQGAISACRNASGGPPGTDLNGTNCPKCESAGVLKEGREMKRPELLVQVYDCDDSIRSIGPSDTLAGRYAR